MTATMIPVPHRVLDRSDETADTATLVLAPTAERLPPWRPGQFTMVYGFGVGEIPVSISGGDSDSGHIHHTVRAVGPVSRAIHQAAIGTVLGLHGPYGTGWPAPPDDADIVVVAGGIGLAPLRPTVVAALARPGRVCVLVGTRTPDDLIYGRELDLWRAAGAQVLVTVDRAATGWTGHVGVVTGLLPLAGFAPADAVGYVCGPEVMMRVSARALVERGVAADRVLVSLERNMRCGTAECGHCQLGPLLVCRDGPVVGYHVAEPLMATRER